jgi:hypothetical protein
MGTTIIPRSNSPFDQYIRNTTTVLGTMSPPPGPVLGWQRLLLTTTEHDSWVDFRDKWAIVYPQYTDLAQRTKSITKDKNDLRDAFIAFAQPLLARIGSSPDITSADRETFNLPERDTTVTERSAILEKADVTLHTLGGLKVEALCRLAADNSRPSRHPQSDAVEYSYTIGAVPSGGGVPGPVEREVGPLLSTSARFIITLTNDDAGKLITIRVRWKNITDDSKSGPWSNTATAMVSY